jgi:hypothetical protein
MDHVFLRDHPPPKTNRPLPSAVRSYRGTVSLATGGLQAGEGFLRNTGASLKSVIRRLQDEAERLCPALEIVNGTRPVRLSGTVYCHKRQFPLIP